MASEKATLTQSGISQRNSKWKTIWKYRALIVLALPGVLLMLINNYLPMFGIFLAFKDLNYTAGIWGSKWIGLDNFKFLFASNDAWLIIRIHCCTTLAFCLSIRYWQ